MSVRLSLAWSYGAQAFIFVLTFAVSVVVARLLGPYEMGIFAVGMSTAGALSILSSFGVSPYLVRHAAPDAIVKATVFTVNAILNLIVTVAILGVVAIGTSVGLNAGVREVLMLLAIAPLINIFDFLPATFLQREMKFKAISLVAMARAVVSSVLLLTFAWSGLGYLSPPIAIIGASLFSTAILNVVARRHQSLRVGLTGWRELTRFGMQMMSIGGVGLLVQRLSELILGRFLGIAALGIYSRASSLSNQIWENMYGLSMRVIFSQMAQEIRETGTVRRTFIHGLAIITAVIWPMLIGLALLARPVIHTLYGDQWIAAALPLSLLMVMQFVSLGFGMNWELSVLRNRTGWQARNEGIRAAVGLASFTLGASFSLAAAAAGRVFEALCGLALFGPGMRAMAGTEPGEIARVYRESAMLMVVAIAPAAVLMAWTGWDPQTSWVAIGAAVSLGVVFWLGLLRKLRHPVMDEIVKATLIMQRLTARAS